MNTTTIKMNPIEAIVNCIVASINEQEDAANRVITACEITEYEAICGRMCSVNVTSDCDGWAEDTNKHLFSFDPYKISFTAEELIGLTEKNAKDLYKTRDDAFYSMGINKMMNHQIKAMLLAGKTPCVPSRWYAEIIATGDTFLFAGVSIAKDEIRIAYDNKGIRDEYTGRSKRKIETFKLSTFIDQFRVCEGWHMQTQYYN